MLTIGMTEDVFDQPPFIMFDAISRFFNIDALWFMILGIFLSDLGLTAS